MDISKIKIGSTTYNIKDAGAREAIASLEGGKYFLGITTTAITDGQDTTGSVVKIDGVDVTPVHGNMVVDSAAQKEYIYYVKGNTKKWLLFGDLSSLGSLAYKNSA